MTPAPDNRAAKLSETILQAFDDLSGRHPGFRPAHAKGILLSGRFTPAATAATLTRAPHILQASTPVTVRLSDFAGIPSIPDNHPDASPRGFALRFHLGAHVHTDIIAHSVNGFPARTAEEFVEFLHAIHASGPSAPKPSPIEAFLGSHPAALEFVQAPKPFPTSFARETFFGVSAYQFTSAEGVVRYGRYLVKPAEGSDYLSAEAAAAMPADYLFAEIHSRLAQAPIKFLISVQVADASDIVDDATVHWPDSRPQVDFGSVEIQAEIADNEAEQRHIIFDPIPRVEGIAPSGDPLLQPRADSYLMSGRRRRADVK